MSKTSTARAIPVPASRISRLTRLGAMTAGVAGSMAVNGVAQLGQGKRPSARNLLLTPGNMRRVADQLAQMRGAAMKVGQLMSMDTGDVMPAELTEILGRLRSDAHFMPPAQLKTVLNANWPKGWLTHFKSFDVHPIAAASIGQVHRACLKDGRDLAIKIQYPGVAQSIDSDVANVGTLIKMSGLLPAGLELAPYLEEARKQLHEETDYQLEGQHLTTFGTLLSEDPRFDLPVVQEDWTTADILAMSFVEGDPIEAAASKPQAERDRIMVDLIELLLAELFTFGLMQTDPNFANYRYNGDSGKIVLLDFGATRKIDPTVAAQYRELLRAGLGRDWQTVETLCTDIGFFAPDTPERHRQQILRMIRIVFDSIQNPLFDFATNDLSQRMQEAGAALAEDGFVPPPVPMDVLYLQRKFGGIFLLGAKLSARVPVTALLEKHLAA
ncbi:MAG: AarF/ABC1/UbiB kinase family protein [Pseudomonadota bacterium]